MSLISHKMSPMSPKWGLLRPAMNPIIGVLFLHRDLIREGVIGMGENQNEQQIKNLIFI